MPSEWTHINFILCKTSAVSSLKIEPLRCRWFSRHKLPIWNFPAHCFEYFTDILKWIYCCICQIRFSSAEFEMVFTKASNYANQPIRSALQCYPWNNELSSALRLQICLKLLNTASDLLRHKPRVYRLSANKMSDNCTSHCMAFLINNVLFWNCYHWNDLLILYCI